jgi:hypothetical protein
MVSVRGYYRKDGTYVRPHYRTSPDGNPYNNYSFPGNYNPNTGEITTGDPAKYLERYYNKSRLRVAQFPVSNQTPRAYKPKLTHSISGISRIQVIMNSHNPTEFSSSDTVQAILWVINNFGDRRITPEVIEDTARYYGMTPVDVAIRLAMQHPAFADLASKLGGKNRIDALQYVLSSKGQPSLQPNEAIQLALSILGYDVGSIDGIIGPRTRLAIICFQIDHDLTPDGIVGPLTLRALSNALALRINNKRH